MTLLRCRVALPSSPDDTIFAAVSIKGTALLMWIQHVLSAAPFFAQTGQVSRAATRFAGTIHPSGFNRVRCGPTQPDLA
jgi:hypothetical protein